MEEFGKNLNQISLDQFDKIVERFGLLAKYSVFQDENGDIMIDEEWSDPNMTIPIKANRIYRFDDNFPSHIQDGPAKNEILQKVLEIFISEEKYEQAAIVRDLINN